MSSELSPNYMKRDESESLLVGQDSEHTFHTGSKGYTSEHLVTYCGTHEGSKCWLNSANITSVIFAILVQCIILYTFGCMVIVFIYDEIDIREGAAALLLCFMSFWSHMATMCGDPGAVPSSAHPLLKDMREGVPITMCGSCDAFKPANAHHDRISNRCISRMDHFCPWMNNAIGAKNQKNFLLFLFYADASSIYILILLTIHLVDCDKRKCNQYSDLTLNLIRVLTCFLVFGVLFTTTMLCNQVYGIVTGLGTIDRMKSKKGVKKVSSPVPFRHIFGDNLCFFFLPFEPKFRHPELVLGYMIEEEYDSI